MGRNKQLNSTDKVNDSNDILTTLRKMFDDFKSDINAQMDEMKKSIEFISEKFDSFKIELSEMKEEIRKQKCENGNLKKEIEKLSLRINDLEQYSRRDNLIVHGVPERKSDSVYDIIDRISTLINARDCMRDISVAHRLPTKEGKRKPIVIKFCKRISRDTWLSKFKEEAKRDEEGPGISSSKLSLECPPSRITAGEHLTAATMDLLNKTRDTAKELNYKFVWIKDGKILVRKNEQSNIKRIYKCEDLDKL